jgi:sigma-B regulation protein RsbU (phosphoserine phosphatase)
MLPRHDPSVAGFEIAGVNLPGETISGDYFDYVELPQGHLGVAVADVSGEGVPAALLAASLQGTMRAHIEDLYSISSIVARTNDSLHAMTRPEEFATLFYAVFDPDGSVTYVNAGHNPPLVFRGSGDVERLWDGGTVLGAFAGLGYDQGRFATYPGDCIVMYTDGLTEAFHGDEEFGEERVIETVRRAHGAPARVVATLLVTEADSFSGPGASADDMTVVVARRVGPDGAT